MSRIEAGIYAFLILFIIIFTLDYLFIKRRYFKRLNGKKKRKKKDNELMELSYLIAKFKLDKSKLPLNKLLVVISLINAFIISIVSVTVLLLDTYTIVRLLVGFVLLMGLIYSLYEILGRILERRGFSKNGNE